MNSQRAIATNIKNFITSVDVRIKRQEATSLQPNQVSYNKQGKMTINAKRPQQTFRSPLLVSCNYLEWRRKLHLPNRETLLNSDQLVAHVLV